MAIMFGVFAFVFLVGENKLESNHQEVKGYKLLLNNTV